MPRELLPRNYEARPVRERARYGFIRTTDANHGNCLIGAEGADRAGRPVNRRIAGVAQTRVVLAEIDCAEIGKRQDARSAGWGFGNPFGGRPRGRGDGSAGAERLSAGFIGEGDSEQFGTAVVTDLR